MQQVLAVDQKTRIFHRHIARHLFHPLLIRMTRNSGQAYPPTLQMNEKQHVVRNQSSERKHFHREEVGRHQYRHVSTDKVFPTRCLLPFRNRWNIMATETGNQTFSRHLRFLTNVVIICTPDKDLSQCVVGSRVVQLDRQRKTLRDEAGVIGKFGIKPPSIPDYLAVVGDSADGYPGISGWGSKTAAAVFSQYPHLEDVPKDWRHWDPMPRRAR